MLYEAYGLSIESTLELPQFRRRAAAPGSAHPQVVVREGSFEWDAPDAARRTSSYDVTPDRILINMLGVARYRVAGGKEIIIDRAEGGRDADVRIFLISSALGALLHQRGLLVLHGSSVEIQGRAAIFLGPSGGGKSTLAAGLVRRGHRLISDDVSALSIGPGAPVSIAPGYPNLKLWKDSIEALSLHSMPLDRVRQGHEKYYLPSDAAFADGALPVGRLYVLEVASSIAPISQSPVEGGDKIWEIIAHTYRPGWIRRMGAHPMHFAMATRLAREATMRRIRRPALSFHLDTLIEAIEGATEDDPEPLAALSGGPLGRRKGAG